LKRGGLLMSLLVLMRPAGRKSLAERCVRVLACLALIKSLVMLWVPGFLPMAIDWLTWLPEWAMRLGSLCDFSFGLLMLWTALIVLRFSVGMGGAQMSTIANRTLGKAGGLLMYLSISLMSFGALLAYVAGMGQVFSSLFGVSDTLGGFIFWVLASLVVYHGLEASGKTELIMSYMMLTLFIGVTLMLIPHTRLSNGLYTDLSGILSITGVAIFALGCHTIIPDVYKGLGSYEKTRKVVVLAFLIPTLVYAVFMASFLLVFGRSTPQVATMGLEEIYGRVGWLVGNLIPLLAITTSYIGIALAQQSNSEEFVRLKRPVAWGLTVIPPAIVYFAGIKNFADVLAFAGDTGDMMAFIILPVLIWIVSKIKHR